MDIYNTNTLPQTSDTSIAPLHVTQDFKHAVLIVSLLVNLAVFVSWVTLLVA